MSKEEYLPYDYYYFAGGSLLCVYYCELVALLNSARPEGGEGRTLFLTWTLEHFWFADLDAIRIFAMYKVCI